MSYFWGFIQETWFVKGILKFQNDLTVFSDSTDKNLHTLQPSLVHSMRFLLIKSEMLLSFPLVWYKDVFISLKVITNGDSCDLNWIPPFWTLKASTHSFESVKTVVLHVNSWMKREKVFKHI